MLRIHVFLLLFFFLNCLSFAAGGENEKIQIRQGKEADVPSIGLRLKMIKDAVQRPMQPPSSNKLRWSDGRELDVMNLAELWFADQCAAYWTAPGISVYAAEMAMPVPSGLETFKGLIDPALYKKWKESIPEDAKISDSEWCAFFTGSQVTIKPPATKAKPSNMSPAMSEVVISDSKLQDKKMYILEGDKGRKIVLLFAMENNINDRAKAFQVLEKCADSAVFLTVRNNAQDTSKVKTTRKTVKKGEYSDKYLQSKESVIQNIKTLKDWSVYETANYVIASNLKKRKDLDEIQGEAEMMRSTFMKVIPPPKAIDAVSVIRVFDKREDYLAYVDSDLQWSGGVWMPSKRELVLSPVDWAKGKDRTELLVRVLRHELFHQYLFFITGERNNLPWFNEGCAQLFESLIIKNDGRIQLDTEKNDYDRGRKIMESQFASAKYLLKLSNKSFQDAREYSYDATWSLMYFIVLGSKAIDKEDYSKIPLKYMEAMAETGDTEKATEAAWKGINLDTFDKDWKEFWSSKRSFAKSRILSVK